MYRLFTLFSVVFTILLSTASAQEGRDLASEIEAVTVYREGALVTRAARAELPPGRHELVFTGLTAELDPSSIQLKATGELTVLSVSHRLDYLEIPGSDVAITQLLDSIDWVDHRRKYWQTRRDIAQEELDLLAANRQFSGQQTGLDATNLERGVSFYRERLAAVKFEQLTIGDSLEGYQKVRNRLFRQLDERRGRTQMATDQVPLSTDSNIDVKYDLPDTVRHDETTGQLEWQLKVAPRASVQVKYSYEVRYPAGTRVYLE